MPVISQAGQPVHQAFAHEECHEEPQSVAHDEHVEELVRNTVVVARLEGCAHGWYEQYRKRFREEVQGEHVIRHQQRLGLAHQERFEPAPPTEREPPQ